jgi:hypothetical protein
MPTSSPGTIPSVDRTHSSARRVRTVRLRARRDLDTAADGEDGEERRRTVVEESAETGQIVRWQDQTIVCDGWPGPGLAAARAAATTCRRMVPAIQRPLFLHQAQQPPRCSSTRRDENAHAAANRSFAIQATPGTQDPYAWLLIGRSAGERRATGGEDSSSDGTCLHVWPCWRLAEPGFAPLRMGSAECQQLPEPQHADGRLDD